MPYSRISCEQDTKIWKVYVSSEIYTSIDAAFEGSASTPTIAVIGAGLAGSEAALQLAARGFQVVLYEQRPLKQTPAHHSGLAAELVCSNSLKSTKEDSAAGLLKRELSGMGSFLLAAARDSSVPAGGALSVDRKLFSEAVEQLLSASPNIRRETKEITSLDELPETCVIVAAGPLCSDALAADIAHHMHQDALAFFDASAPIVDTLTIDRSIAFSQSRYDREGESSDYLNCPFEKDEYENFIDELVAAKRVISKDFETNELFSACQPVEEIARKGRDALRFGTMKPVGLTDPRTGKRPFAAVQLRAENRHKTAYNLVGFQTNLRWGEQARIFRMIPGLEQADFLRYGVMHRNSFIDAPKVLDQTFALPNTRYRFAGQITGTEGYVEAIASGLIAALQTVAELTGQPAVELPITTSFGSLVAYATDPNTHNYQPMHVNFGLLPPLEIPIKNKGLRRSALAHRAKEDFDRWRSSHHELFF